jgi:hypothetical protein
VVNVTTKSFLIIDPPKSIRVFGKEATAIHQIGTATGDDQSYYIFETTHGDRYLAADPVSYDHETLIYRRLRCQICILPYG